ncbi:nucleotidyltransferase domain-containing protein [Agrobacterium tumefaciens]|uniref:nucleotidyltransferase domain-containing protein n=1 Tax=Agrobacterium tumefaciens TaxID=358 RepID=UPI0021D2CF5F|nr:hypothetical protein [Agrobacterium tumefaciens]UXS05449.1 hypothetical protein FY156_28285 [Agrobacterium tumefaciens]
MPNTRETLAAVLELLKDCSVECDIFGGWAEELLGSRQPWQHGDIDLIYRGAEFAPVDMAISYQHKRFAEVAGKRFRHKRAFVFRETLCEIILVQDSSTTPTTYYWGDVPFRWHHPFLHHETIDLYGKPATIVSSANLQRHRDLYKDAQPHRWRSPESLEP